MKKVSVFSCLVAILSILNMSCSKDKDNDNTSRVLKYEVTGNYTGSLIASYTSATGGTTNETMPALPWSKEVTYAWSVTAANISITGNLGTPGQQVTLIVKRGGSQVSSTPITADNSGSFSKAAQPVIFWYS